MQCRAIFCATPEFGGLWTNADPGELTVDAHGLHMTGEMSLSVDFTAIRCVRMFRHCGLCRMIEVIHDEGTLFVAPIRGLFFCGCFAWVNFFKTGELFRLLSTEVPRVHAP